MLSLKNNAAAMAGFDISCATISTISRSRSLNRASFARASMRAAPPASRYPVRRCAALAGDMGLRPSCASRIAPYSASRADALRMNPTAPASIACGTYSCSSNVVRMMTRGAFGRFVSARVASMPLMRSMRTSMRTTSG